MYECETNNLKQQATTEITPNQITKESHISYISNYQDTENLQFLLNLHLSKWE